MSHYLSGYLSGYEFKEAKAPYGGTQYQVQNYAPIHERRELSSDEASEFTEAEKKLIPKIFQTNEDKISVKSSSPVVSALISGLLGGTVGAGAGGLLGSAIGGGGNKEHKPFEPRKSNYEHKDPQGATKGGVIGAAVGGLGLGGLAALLAYHAKKAKNADLRESARRLPEGGRIRDLKSDPVYQADLDRAAMMHAMSARYGN